MVGEGDDFGLVGPNGAQGIRDGLEAVAGPWWKGNGWVPMHESEGIMHGPILSAMDGALEFDDQFFTGLGASQSHGCGHRIGTRVKKGPLFSVGHHLSHQLGVLQFEIMEVAIAHRAAKLLFDHPGHIGMIVTMQRLSTKPEEQVDVLVAIDIGDASTFRSVDAGRELNGMKGPQYAIADAALLQRFDFSGAFWLTTGQFADEVGNERVRKANRHKFE